jgi:hypothetical protein
VNEIARKIEATWPVDYILLRCSELMIENAMLQTASESYQKAFNVLLEKYKLRDELFSARIAEMNEAYLVALGENKAEYQELFDDVAAEYAREFNSEKVGEYAINALQPHVESLTKDAHIAGQKDGVSINAKMAAHKSHAEDYKTKALAFDWFASNIQNYRGKLNDCAEAFAKIEPIKFSTARAWLRDWRKAQKTKPKL